MDIHCPDKAQAEAVLRAALLEKLNDLPAGQWVMLKLTLPEQDGLYADCISHANVVRVVALSGGYTREEANNRRRVSALLKELQHKFGFTPESIVTAAKEQVARRR